MGRSPVSVTRSKKFTLDNKLKRLGHKFSNKGYIPRVYFFVVMTGNADFRQLPEVELLHTLSLRDFLEFADKIRFNEYFRPHPNGQVLNQDFPVFDQFFLSGNTAPKALRIGGYPLCTRRPAPRALRVAPAATDLRVIKALFNDVVDGAEFCHGGGRCPAQVMRCPLATGQHQCVYGFRAACHRNITGALPVANLLGHGLDADMIGKVRLLQRRSKHGN